MSLFGDHNIMAVAEAINRLCKDAKASDHTRAECHRLHGEVIQRGGSDDDAVEAVRSLLANRTAAKPAPPPVRWDMPTFPDEDNAR